MGLENVGTRVVRVSPSSGLVWRFWSLCFTVGLHSVSWFPGFSSSLGQRSDTQLFLLLVLHIQLRTQVKWGVRLQVLEDRQPQTQNRQMGTDRKRHGVRSTGRTPNPVGVQRVRLGFCSFTKTTSCFCSWTAGFGVRPCIFSHIYRLRGLCYFCALHPFPSHEGHLRPLQPRDQQQQPGPRLGEPASQ